MAMTAVFLAIDYIAGFFIFGIFYWIINGILPEMNLLTPGTDLHTWSQYIWNALLIVYIGLGAWSFLTRLKIYDIRR